MGQKTTLHHLNSADRETFTRICGPFFEHSPWVAERTSPGRPFASVDALHAALCQTMRDASAEEQLKLIRAHPELVGRLARQGALTASSTAEQGAAGLDQVTPEEAALFDRYNAAYRERFGFPFIICARENRKNAILAAFPLRLNNTPQQERAAALDEIAKIARLRLLDAISETPLCR